MHVYDDMSGVHTHDNGCSMFDVSGGIILRNLFETPEDPEPQIGSLPDECNVERPRRTRPDPRVYREPRR